MGVERRNDWPIGDDPLVNREACLVAERAPQGGSEGGRIRGMTEHIQVARRYVQPERGGTGHVRVETCKCGLYARSPERLQIVRP